MSGIKPASQDHSKDKRQQLRHRNVTLALIITAMFTMAVSQTLLAASCKSEATISAGIWKQYRNVTETIGCKSSLGGVAEYAGCGATRLFNETNEGMIGWWNSGAKNRWATIGLRTLGAEPENGTVLKTTKRTFISLVPSFNEGKIIVQGIKRKGKVTVCASDASGKTEKLFNDVTVDDRRVFNISRNNAEGKVLSLIRVIQYGSNTG